MSWLVNSRGCQTCTRFRYFIYQYSIIVCVTNKYRSKWNQSDARQCLNHLSALQNCLFHLFEHLRVFKFYDPCFFVQSLKRVNVVNIFAYSINWSVHDLVDTVTIVIQKTLTCASHQFHALRACLWKTNFWYHGHLSDFSVFHQSRVAQAQYHSKLLW